MFKKKNKSLPITLFIIASILILSVYVLVFLLFYKESNYRQALNTAESNDSSIFFLNEDYSHDDPYTTKIPNLRDMLKGPIVTDLDPQFGDLNSDIVMVVFADFECAYYKKNEELLKSLSDEYGLRLVWKDYPANDINSSSFKASVAARCAQVEGAFWDYHDKLFSGNYKHTKTDFMQIARELNLDTDDFESCIDNQSTAQLVYDNMMEADALGIDGIPFIYVNDQQLQGDIDETLLRKLIEVEKEE